MSRLNIFSDLATEHGSGSIRDHIANYFGKTGIPPTRQKVTSLRTQVTTELKPVGKLYDLVVNRIILPSDNNRPATWSKDLVPVADAQPLNLVPSDAAEQSKRLMASNADV